MLQKVSFRNWRRVKTMKEGLLSGMIIQNQQRKWQALLIPSANSQNCFPHVPVAERQKPPPHRANIGMSPVEGVESHMTGRKPQASDLGCLFTWHVHFQRMLGRRATNQVSVFASKSLHREARRSLIFTTKQKMYYLLILVSSPQMKRF